MRVFVTGASGFVGRAVVPELLAAGHDVVGLVRSDAAAAIVAATGASVRRGDLDDLDGIRAGALEADGVVHLANKHDFANPAESNRAERAAVQTISDALEGTGKPFLLAAGTAGLAPGRVATEADPNPGVGPDAPRGGAENLALSYADRGVRVVSARFAPTVHGAGDHGFVRVIADTFSRRGVATWVGDGAQRWSAVHRGDTARLVRLALEQAPAGTIVHAVGEEGVRMRDLVQALAARRGLPIASIDAETLAAEVPFIGRLVGTDMPASSAATRALLGWTPTGPSLLDDVAAGAYDA